MTAMTWGRTSRAFHWLGAALIFYLLIHGFWMVGLPREARFGHYETHAAGGYLFIVFMLARLVVALDARGAVPAGRRATLGKSLPAIGGSTC